MSDAADTARAMAVLQQIIDDMMSTHAGQRSEAVIPELRQRVIMAGYDDDVQRLLPYADEIAKRHRPVVGIDGPVES